MCGIEGILDILGEYNWFVSLDIKAGFYNIPVALPSQPFLAFVTEDGAWTYTRLPMGVTTVPDFFQRVMLRILATLHLHICVVYVDDVTVFG